MTVYSDADGIEEIDNGQLTMNNEVIYTLSGIRMDRVTKTGIYIVNGKKRLVKVK